MNPIAFGSRARQLFGVFHPSSGSRVGEGIVLCPPFGSEYIRAHRALRVLGDRLAGAGFDVFRFDYFGTGDSGGTGKQLSLGGASEDVSAAIDELCAIAGVERVTVAGVRFGALAAIRVAPGHDRVDRLILWDPVDSEAAAEAMSDPETLDDQGDFWHDGYPVAASLVTELRQFDESAWNRTAELPTLIVCSEATPPERLRRLHAGDAWTGSWADFPEEVSWAQVNDLGHGAVPVRIFDRIVAWCT